MKTLEQIFAVALGLDEQQIHDDLGYNTIAQWDSVAHMGLVAMLEDHFGVLLSANDIIDMSSVAQARTILRRNGAQL
ncbi:acyl carrier protein [Shewanella sp. NFH-SH190041]|uniref:acyl carrier protein n=1 Tax=Shewanella sp. NFH-SH190041 TaxID=2950245 RepID=UPI0021C3F8D9|nr:acyl carrier protein [Shewanella sp. NFH-SH190041]BDM63733.1 acyl carrier protein [Shewanella sp. NFH-SH190041]